MLLRGRSASAPGGRAYLYVGSAFAYDAPLADVDIVDMRQELLEGNRGVFPAD